MVHQVWLAHMFSGLFTGITECGVEALAGCGVFWLIIDLASYVKTSTSWAGIFPVKVFLMIGLSAVLDLLLNCNSFLLISRCVFPFQRKKLKLYFYDEYLIRIIICYMRMTKTKEMVYIFTFNLLGFCAGLSQCDTKTAGDYRMLGL